MSDVQAALKGVALPGAAVRLGALRERFARLRSATRAARPGDELEPALAAVLRRLVTDGALALQIATVGEGRGDVALAVASALAAGASAVVPGVLLLDGTEAPGVDTSADVAAGPVSIAEKMVDGRKIEAAALGTAAGSPERRRALLAGLRRERRLVLLAGGAVNAAVEATRAATADAVLLVVRAGIDRQDAVARATQLLAEAGAPLFGAVLIGTRALPFGLDRLLGRGPVGVSR